MGTLSFSVTNATGYSDSALIAGTVRTSGAFTTSGTAANVEDASGDITLSQGEVFRGHADEAMRIAQGMTATTSTGHYIPAGETIEFFATQAAVVSVIDAA